MTTHPSDSTATETEHSQARKARATRAGRTPLDLSHADCGAPARVGAICEKEHDAPLTELVLNQAPRGRSRRSSEPAGVTKGW
jgi:hypothetical protein